MATPETNPLAGLAAPQIAGELVLYPAKITDRFIAYVIDVAPFCAGYFATLYTMVMKWHTARYTTQLNTQVGLAWFGLYILYQLIGTATGATIGKRLLGLRIVRKDGQPLGFGGALMRAIGYVIGTPLCSWGFILALFHPESRALHDLLAGSIVIEPQRRNQAESALLFVCATLLLCGMYGAVIVLNMNRITERDILAVEKAKDGLKVMAQVEEEYKAGHQVYTSSMADLAAASGDADKFRSAMAGIFDPNQFELQAGNRGYRLSGKALDHRHTRVTIEGPPPTIAE